MAIMNTYVARKHRKHIHKIWHLLGTQYKEAFKAYRESGLFGERLCGNESLYETLYFSGYQEIANKYHRNLPEDIAFGEIHTMVLKCVNGKEI